MGLLWGILSLQFPGLLSTRERERETVLSAFAVRAPHLHADLISTKQVHLLQTNTYTAEYVLASRRLHSPHLFTCQPTCHLQLGAACIICMQMSFGTFSCPHAFPFPYFCNAFFFFLQFILRFARLCCGLVPALGLALSHSNGGLIKHKPKSSDDDGDDDSCNCR